MMCLIY